MSKKRFFYCLLCLLHISVCSPNTIRCPNDAEEKNECPPTWYKYNKDCYKFFQVPKIKQGAAMEACNKLGARLVRIDSTKELDFLFKIITSSFPSSQSWYTSGVMTDTFNVYRWLGQLEANQEFRDELKQRIATKLPVTTIDKNKFPKDQRYLVLRFDAAISRFVLAVEKPTDRSYICQVSTRDVANMFPPGRGVEFGQNVLSSSSSPSLSYKRGPCITRQPRSVWYVNSNKLYNYVQFKLSVYGNPQPTVMWYWLRSSTTGLSDKPDPIRPDSDPFGRIAITGGILTIYNPDRNRHKDPVYAQACNDLSQCVISDKVRIKFAIMGTAMKQEQAAIEIPMNRGRIIQCPLSSVNPVSGLSYTWGHQPEGYTRPENIRTSLRPNIFISQALGFLAFSDTSSIDSGKYECAYQWRFAELSTITAIKAPAIPVLIRQGSRPFDDPRIPVGFPAVFPTNPQYGESATLECFSYGSMRESNRLEYAWSLNGQSIGQPADELKQTVYKYTLTDFNRKLVIRDLKFEDENTYTCMVTAQNGRNKQGSVKLKVNSPPFFTSHPVNQYVAVGENVSFTCQGDGRPRISLVWYHNSLPLTEWLRSAEATAIQVNTGGVGGSARYRVSTTDDASWSQLRIDNVRQADSAMYGCRIANKQDAKFAYAELSVKRFKPNFNGQTVAEMNGALGGSLTIPINVQGGPTPTIRWQFNGQTLSPSPIKMDAATGKFACSTAKHCVYPNNNLLVSNLASSDAGKYTVVATNELVPASQGGVTFDIYVKINEAIGFQVAPKTREVSENSTIYLPCRATATNGIDVDYQWWFEDRQINFDRLDMDARRYDLTQFDQPFGRYYGFLRISNIQYEYEGRYSCRIVTSNSIKDHAAAYIFVRGVPSPCGGVSVTTETNVTSGVQTNSIMWTIGSSKGADILWYRIEVRGLNDQFYSGKWITVADKIRESPDLYVDKTNDKTWRRQYKFFNLPANQEFYVRVRAANAYGLAKPSVDEVKLFTPAVKPTQKVENVTGGGGKTLTLVARCNVVPELFHNGPDFSYMVEYKPIGETVWIKPNTNEFTQLTLEGKWIQFTITLAQAKPNTPYNVRIGTKNSVGDGPWSDTKTINSAEKKPQKGPLSVNAASLNATAIRVTWIPRKLDPEEGKILGYNILYWPRSSSKCVDYESSQIRRKLYQRQTVYGEDKTQANIIGLLTDQYYCIHVSLFNSAGISLQSANKEQTTYKAQPSRYPTRVMINSTGEPNSVHVEWNGVTARPMEESISGYKIRYWDAGAPVRTAKDVDVGWKQQGTIYQLNNEVRYNLRVFAYSKGGHGRLSSPMNQFMIVPKSRCEEGKIIEGPDVRYVFVCSACTIKSTILMLVAAVLFTIFNNSY